MSVLTGADRAQETAQSVGLSATITLLGAAGLGLQTFASAGLNGKLVPYVIEHTTSGQWEVGEGIYTASGAVLNRTIVYANSLGTTAPINFALGLVEVWVDMPAEKAVMLDADSAHLTLPAGLSIAGQLDGVTVLDVATLNVSTSIQPTADNAVSLGTASKRWSDIRAMTATLSGLLSGAAATFSGLVTAAAGAVISAAQTLALAGALISGAPTWGSSQAITLSTAAQPAITSVGTLTSLTMGGAIGAQAITPNTDNLYALGTASFRWSDVRGVTGTFTTLTAALTGNASTATALQNARTINGVSFDGTGNIVVTAAANTLTTTTLNATVINSSLQTLGTVSTAVWAAQAVNPGTDNLSTLGTASKRWSDLQAVTGTFGGAVTLSSTLAIGGITYTFPASQGASRFLQTDGSGNLSWVAEGATISLAGLSDVTITSATNGQALIYSSGSGKWTNTFTSLLTGLGTVTTGAWAAGAVNPAVDNSATLGTASKRWSDLQAMTATFGGAVVMSSTLNVTGAITGALTGNASTATALATARAINGVNFDGTAPITVTADANTLSGTNLHSTIVTSSLTTFGTLAAPLLFVDNTYDIGAAGATRPRTGYFATSVITTTLTGTLSTASQPNVTTMAALVSVGTITTGVWNAGAGTFSGLVTASAGATIASAQTFTLTGATVAGAPTWSSNQAITLSTAAQPNVTSLGTLAANLLFVDATYDIGASAANRPQNIFVHNNGTFGGNVAAAAVSSTGGGMFGGLVTAGLGVSLGGGSLAPGVIVVHASFGTSIVGTTGSLSDLALFSAAGGLVAFVPTGTVNWQLVSSGDLILGRAYVATPQVGTGYIIMKDNTGTSYKFLVST